MLEPHLALMEGVGGQPLVGGNKVTLLVDGPATYAAMFQAIAHARDHIHLQTYILEDDAVGQCLAAALVKKQSGRVQVNLIYDSVGSRDTPKSFFDHLKSNGIRVIEFNPINPLAVRKRYLLNHRDHRKILVIDGKIGFLGGINFSKVYSASIIGRRVTRSAARDREAWRDTHVRIEGPVVAELQRLFLETWHKQHGDPLPPRDYFPHLQMQGDQVVRVIGSSPADGMSYIYITLLSAITHAQSNVYLTIAYFVPNPDTIEVIKCAARRGVDIRLILPSYSDFWMVFHAGRSHYTDLLSAGVKIYERLDALLHAKTAVIDGVWSTVGSANIDWRSFLHNDEVNIIVLDRDFAHEMTTMFQQDLAGSVPIDLEQWQQRPLRDRLKEWAARLLEYWL